MIRHKPFRSATWKVTAIIKSPLHGNTRREFPLWHDHSTGLFSIMLLAQAVWPLEIGEEIEGFTVEHFTYKETL